MGVKGAKDRGQVHDLSSSTWSTWSAKEPAALPKGAANQKDSFALQSSATLFPREKPSSAKSILERQGGIKPKDKPPRGMKRVAKKAAELEVLLGSAPPELLEALIQQDGRFEAFKLEALLRMYSQIHGRPVSKALAIAKALEDRLGDYKVAQDVVHIAEQIALPKPVIKRLKRDANRSQRKALALLEAHWVPKDGRIVGLEKIFSKLEKVKWKKPARDRAQIAKGIARHIAKIEKTDYPFEKDIEAVHDFRKALRWIVLYSLGSDGVVTLFDDQKAPTAPPPGAEKYATLPVSAKGASEDGKAVQLPRSLHIRLLELITELGDLKDAIELRDILAGAMSAELGLPKSEAQTMIRDKLGLPPGLEARSVEAAKRLHKVWVQGGLLKMLRAHFEVGAD